MAVCVLHRQRFDSVGVPLGQGGVHQIAARSQRIVTNLATWRGHTALQSRITVRAYLVSARRFGARCAALRTPTARA